MLPPPVNALVLIIQLLISFSAADSPPDDCTGSEGWASMHGVVIDRLRNLRVPTQATTSTSHPVWLGPPTDRERIMTSKSSRAPAVAGRTPLARGLLALLPLGLAATTAQAATDSSGQVLTLTPNAGETAMTIYWLTSLDGFGPPAPCNIKPYTLTFKVDDITLFTLNESKQKLTQGPNGRCVLQRTFSIGGRRLSPGIWAATAKRPSSAEIAETRPIYACTAIQGKQPMYSAYHPQYTDHFYTLSASDRNAALTIGYVDPNTPFAMPSAADFHSVPFYRYFKGAPQLEHFYTHDANEWQFVEQNGYVYEGIEGYLFTRHKPGTTELYRFTKFDGSTGDLLHFYSINFYDSRSGDMTYEGVVGYVCSP
jgi:Repeat of unknown function (DUF5648)